MTSFFIMASHKTEMTVCELAAVASNINVKSCFCVEARLLTLAIIHFRSSIDAKSS